MKTAQGETNDEPQEQEHYSESQIITELESLIKGPLDVEKITSALNEKLKGLNISSSLVAQYVLNSHRNIINQYRELVKKYQDIDNKKKKQLDVIRLIVASQLGVELKGTQKKQLEELNKVIEKDYDQKPPPV
jgi:hypothetical protein